MPSVDVWVLDFGPDRDAASKTVQKVFGLDAKGARQLIASAPVALKKDVPVGLALALSGALRDSGAAVRVVPAGSPRPTEATPDAPEVRGKKPVRSIRPPEDKQPAAKRSEEAEKARADATPRSAAKPDRPKAKAKAKAKPERKVAPAGSEGAERAVAQARSQRLILWVLLVGLAGAVGFVLWWQLASPAGPHTAPFTAAQTDRLATRLLADPSRHDAAQWLQHGDLLYTPRARARQLVDAISAAGASSVVASDLTSVGQREGMASLVVELPESDSGRVLAAAREGCGLDPGGEPIARDVSIKQGSRYLVITFR